MRISDWSSDVCSSDLNPRIRNLHGHILKFSEEGDSPLATKFSWEIFLLAGDPSLAAGGSNLIGDIDGDTFSSPDGIRIDPQGRLWVQTDHRSEEHTSELQSLMRISYAVFCLKKKKTIIQQNDI